MTCRDPDLHLFRPPLPAPTARSRAPRPVRERAVAEQLRLEADTEPVTLADGRSEDTADDPADHRADEASSDVGPWSPSFDEADDLDGLLSARSPLLSRAFRIAGRPDE